jgi:hypothetical protein
MAKVKFSNGKRSQKLARLVKDNSYNAQTSINTDDYGTQIISEVTAACIVITREMVVKSYFNGKPEYEASVDKWMDAYALKCEGNIICNTPSKIVVCDDNGEKAMSLRFRIDHQMDIARYSEKLGVSRNDFVIKAIENYVRYLNEIEDMEE